MQQRAAVVIVVVATLSLLFVWGVAGVQTTTTAKTKTNVAVQARRRLFLANQKAQTKKLTDVLKTLATAYWAECKLELDAQLSTAQHRIRQLNNYYSCFKFCMIFTRSQAAQRSCSVAIGKVNGAADLPPMVAISGDGSLSQMEEEVYKALNLPIPISGIPALSQCKFPLTRDADPLEWEELYGATPLTHVAIPYPTVAHSSGGQQGQCSEDQILATYAKYLRVRMKPATIAMHTVGAPCPHTTRALNGANAHSQITVDVTYTCSGMFKVGAVRAAIGALPLGGWTDDNAKANMDHAWTTVPNCRAFP